MQLPTFRSANSLEEQVDHIADALLSFKGDAEVTLTLPIHNDTPDEFVAMHVSDEGTTRYEKVISAKEGRVTKRILLVVPE